MSENGRRHERARAMRAHPAGKRLVEHRLDRGARPEVGRDRSPHSRVRLTARGRRLVAWLAAVALLGGVGLVGALSGTLGGGRELHLAGQSQVVVRPGDTLWAVAASVAGDDDVREVVYRIQQANHLRGSVLLPGEVLVLP